jgi:hypothetical protein
MDANLNLWAIEKVRDLLVRALKALAQQKAAEDLRRGSA